MYKNKHGRVVRELDIYTLNINIDTTTKKKKEGKLLHHHSQRTSKNTIRVSFSVLSQTYILQQKKIEEGRMDLVNWVRDLYFEVPLSLSNFLSNF